MVLSKVRQTHLGDLHKVTQTFAPSWGDGSCKAPYSTVCS